MTHSLEGHADRRFDGEFNSLHILILELGGLVLAQTRLAMQAILQQDLSAAQTVLGYEDEIDRLNSLADHKIIELIGKRAPVAKDLRITMAFSKMVVVLDEIAEEAEKIANIVMMINDGNQPKPGKRQMRDIVSIGRLSIDHYFESAMKSFDCLDAGLAESLLNAEIELDDEFQSALRFLTTFVLEDARNLKHSINITLILKSLERIGVKAGYIATLVIYLVHGNNVRQQKTHKC